jgi:hypothetical protein
VEVLSAYLNPEDQIQQLRTTLAALRLPCDHPTTPDFDASMKGGCRGMSVDPLQLRFVI